MVTVTYVSYSPSLRHGVNTKQWRLVLEHEALEHFTILPSLKSMFFFSRMRSEKGNFPTFNPKPNPDPAKNKEKTCT